MTGLRPVESLSRATWARMKNDLLGGKEALSYDLAALKSLREVSPDLSGYVSEEDGFVARTWRHLAARRGVTQFIHAGAPLPVRRPPHWAGWDAAPARGPVVYVEPDPLLAAKGRNDLEDHPQVTVLDGDLRQVAAMLADERIRTLIDFDEPFAIIIPSVLDRVRAGRAAAILDQLQCELPRPSYIVATHALDPEYPEGSNVAQGLEARMRIVLGEDVAFRTKDEIEQFFDAWTLLKPGVTRCGGWWPNGPTLRDVTVAEQLVVGVVAMPPS